MQPKGPWRCTSNACSTARIQVAHPGGLPGSPIIGPKHQGIVLARKSELAPCSVAVRATGQFPVRNAPRAAPDTAHRSQPSGRRGSPPGLLLLPSARTRLVSAVALDTVGLPDRAIRRWSSTDTRSCLTEDSVRARKESPTVPLVRPPGRIDLPGFPLAIVHQSH